MLAEYGYIGTGVIAAIVVGLVAELVNEFFKLTERDTQC